VQFAAWCVVMFFAFSRRRRRVIQRDSATVFDAPVMSLSDEVSK
jgi:hypothetical protein